MKICQEEVIQQNASDYIDVRTQFICDLDETGKLDAIYFPASFMLLSDQKNALLIAIQSLKDDGVICFTQTFETRATPSWK